MKIKFIVLVICLVRIKQIYGQSPSALMKIDSTLNTMWKAEIENKITELETYYTPDAHIVEFDLKQNKMMPRHGLRWPIAGNLISWEFDLAISSGDDDMIFQNGTVHLTYGYTQKRSVYSYFSNLLWLKQPGGKYKIAWDSSRFKDTFNYHYYDIIKDSTWISLGSDSIFAIIYKPKANNIENVPGVFCMQGGGDAGIENYTYEAELFAHAGIASIVCDKSGSGKSKGKSSWVTQSFTQKINEYISILDWFRKQPYIDSSSVGLHGPSEGGRLALAMLLAKPEKIKFVNAVSAPLETYKENQLFAIDQLLQSQGYPRSVIGHTVSLFDAYFECIKSGAISSDLVKRIKKLRNDYPTLYLPPDTTQLPRMPRPEDIDFSLGNDLRLCQKPVLFQYGDADSRVNVQKSIQQIPLNPNLNFLLYKNADHSINLPNGDTHKSYMPDKLRWVLSNSK